MPTEPESVEVRETAGRVDPVVLLRLSTIRDQINVAFAFHNDHHESPWLALWGNELSDIVKRLSE